MRFFFTIAFNLNYQGLYSLRIKLVDSNGVGQDKIMFNYALAVVSSIYSDFMKANLLLALLNSIKIDSTLKGPQIQNNFYIININTRIYFKTEK